MLMSKKDELGEMAWVVVSFKFLDHDDPNGLAPFRDLGSNQRLVGFFNLFLV